MNVCDTQPQQVKAAAAAAGPVTVGSSEVIAYRVVRPVAGAEIKKLVHFE